MTDHTPPPVRRAPSPPGPAPADPLAALPDLVRVGLRTSLRPGLRATQQFLGGAASVTGRIAGVLLGDEDPLDAATAIRGEVVSRTRETLALDVDPGARPGGGATETSGGPGRVTAARLRRRGQALLARSADVDVDVEVHPAFESILDQLAPDEARILRTLARNGPQPVVSVEMRSRVRGASRRILARNEGRLAPEAGCRHPERTEAYLDNLARLGLIRVSREEVGGDELYEILGVQPAVVQAQSAARDLGGRSRLLRGSVVLSAFGASFVAACLD